MSVIPGQYNAGGHENRARRRIRWAAFFIPIVAACNATDLLIPAGSLTIEPASLTVPVQPNSGFVIPITISNSSETTVYMDGGCGWSVEQSRLMGDEGPRQWVRVLLPVCALELPPGSPSVPINPGQVLVFMVDTRGTGLGPSTVLNGQYRVSVALAVMRFGELRLLPHDQSVSTPFTVVAN
jgi:hypothetical protein